MIQASLQRVHLSSPQPRAMAEFYQAAYAMRTDSHDGSHCCQAPGRELWFSAGAANQLGHALFRLQSDTAWNAFIVRTGALASAPDGLPALPASTRVFADPDGNRIAFAPPAAAAASSEDDDVVPSAVLQHFALRTPQLETMLAFYRDRLGFVVSDLVRTEGGELTAAFLRTDVLHHSVALFRAPVSCFDHQSFETIDWHTLKVWADRTGRSRIPIVWGIGRHGPGDDVFFMVRDPDDNLAEISAEIEVCRPERATGLWPHEEWTLNQWGKAILRS
ncbi:MAG: VOC family protein [Pigmentiphaga sp.]